MGAERIVHTGAIMAVTSNFKVNVEPKTNIVLIPYNYLHIIVDTLKIVYSSNNILVTKTYFHIFANYSKWINTFQQYWKTNDLSKCFLLKQWFQWGIDNLMQKVFPHRMRLNTTWAFCLLYPMDWFLPMNKTFFALLATTVTRFWDNSKEWII